MNITKIIVSIVVSIVFTAITLATVSYFIDDELLSGSSWILGPEPWEFKVIIVAVYGIIIGATAGIIITGFNMNIFIGMVFGLLFNLFLTVTLIFLAGGGEVGEGLAKVLYASIIIGVINGAIVSLVNSWQQSLN